MEQFKFPIKNTPHWKSLSGEVSWTEIGGVEDGGKKSLKFLWKDFFFAVEIRKWQVTEDREEGKRRPRLRL